MTAQPSERATFRDLNTAHVTLARTVEPQEKPAYCYQGYPERHQYKTISHYWTARPGTEVLNRATGEITVVPEYLFASGKSLTISKFATKLGKGPRETRAILAELGVLHSEIRVKMVPAVIAFCNGSPEMWGQSAQSKPKYEETLRLSEWAVKMRYGCRVPTVTGHDCDILTASGMKWIEEIVSLVDRQTEPKPPTKAADIIEGLLKLDPAVTPVAIIEKTGLPKMTVYRNYKKLREMA
ncbi:MULTISPECIES: hypothetical protein [Bacteria]|uniref:Uncharacterized protein n=1 Tax=Nostoc favosum CHAB5714 TaxID=2780399 RepID=A0ABS8IKG3_9NOSO|nr:hypothetical protein [Nostoc favosum]MBQ9353653.1 hypothetical protein [Phyllobacterium sp.]MCC5604775.1 hypothetical protein [Nostoc favosum CHAB5714]